MATALSNLTLAAQLLTKMTETRDATIVETPQVTGLDFTPSTALANGTAANQADRWLQNKSLAISSGATRDLDVYDGANIFDSTGDLLGNVVALAEVVAIAIVNRATSAGSLKIGGQGAGPAFNSIFDSSDTAKVIIKPGGLFFIFSPTDPAYAVADTTNHLLRLEASGGDVTCDVFVLGRSA